MVNVILNFSLQDLHVHFSSNSQVVKMITQPNMTFLKLIAFLDKAVV